MLDQRPLAALALATLLLHGCATLEDGVAAIAGKGGTIARSDEFTKAAAHAREVANGRPATVWEARVPQDAADFIRFVDADRVLVGNVEIGAYLGVPDYQQLSLFDARSGEKLWEAQRRKLLRGEYSLIARSPLIVMLGKSETELVLFGLDPATGARRWEREYKKPLAHGMSKDSRRFFVVTAAESRHELSAVDLHSGAALWSQDVALETQGGEGHASILVDDRELYVLDRNLRRFDAGDGRLLWSFDAQSLGGSGASAMETAGGMLAWSARAMTLIDAKSGKPRWHYPVEKGGIKLVSPLEGRIFALIAPDDTDLAAGPLPVDAVEAIDSRNGRRHWRREVGGAVVSQLALARGQLLLALEDAVLGLNAATGAVQFRDKLPAAFRLASPANYDPPGQPDLVHVREGRLYLARESAGLIAYALPQGRQLWRQGNVTLNSRDYAYSLPQRTERMKTALAMNGQAAKVRPTGASLYSAQPNVQMQQLQRQEIALSDARREAMARGDTTKAAHYAGLGEVNAQMQSFSRQMEAAQGILAAGMALNQAIENALKQEALNGLVTRMMWEIEHASRLHREAFQGRYYLRPYVDGWADKVHGITVIDLETGRRCDLAVSPVITAISSVGLDAPKVRLDPTGTRLLTVGVGLKPELYEPYVKWKVRIPRPSLLAYELSGLPFVARNAAMEERMALAESAPPAPAREFIDATRIGNPYVVRRLLDEGVDVNTRSVHGYTALMIAADAGNEALTRLLVRRGADVGLTVEGQGALDFAASPSIRKLLADAGASPAPAGKEGAR